MEIPVLLFAFARSEHLRRVLECLKRDKVPLILAYADGARDRGDAEGVAEVRKILRTIDWCEVRMVERAENFGLGRNIIAGVSEAARLYPAFIVWEDDLISVAGTYQWICSALRHYKDDATVGSISAWTHSKVTPQGIGDAYFDGRAECWVWGSWSRAWEGMQHETALFKMRAAERRGIPRDSYGSDLPQMARKELKRNIWAVRWLYHHLQHEYLCLRPSRSLIEHIGFGGRATNAVTDSEWGSHINAEPADWSSHRWPPPRENPACRKLWQAAAKRRPLWLRVSGRLKKMLSIP
jgi:hypothetical protein